VWHHFLQEQRELSWKHLLLKIKIVVEAIASHGKNGGDLVPLFALLAMVGHGWL